MTHAGEKSAALSYVNNWYAQQLAYLGQALLATPDVDGKSVLDNTLIYWCSDVAWGYTHTFDGMRAFFLGSCGGAVKTGQHIAAGGQTHQKVARDADERDGLDGEFIRRSRVLSGAP